MGRNASRLFRSARRGQAMVEYSVVTFILSLGALGLLSVPIPTGVNGRGTAPLFRLFWEGLNGFYDSVYYVLQCSIP
jgi:hypothetical protein